MDKNVFKRILDNMVFAMNLSDDMSEHFMTEIMRDKVAHGTEDLFAKPELVEDCNAEVNGTLRPQFRSQLPSRPPLSLQQYPQSEEVPLNEVLTITSRPSDSNTLRLLDSYSSKYLDYQSLNTLDFSTLRTKVIDFSDMILIC